MNDLLATLPGDTPRYPIPELARVLEAIDTLRDHVRSEMRGAMVTIRISQRTGGLGVAEANSGGREFHDTSRTGALCALCRQLFAAFIPDGPWRAVDARGLVRLSGPSIYAMARLTTGEGADGRVRWRFLRRPSPRC